MDCPGLSEAMRLGSRAEHRAAESTQFVADVFSGGVRRSTYARYLNRLREVYAALEDVVHAHRGHPLLAALYDPRLHRMSAIEADLDQWGRQPADSAAVGAYVDRIRQAADRPELLVAHHYTRYLGDLSGGRLLARKLAQAFGPGAGLSFYSFPLIDRPEAYKRDYRRTLDALPLDGPHRGRVVTEVRTAFLLNCAVLDELSAEGRQGSGGRVTIRPIPSRAIDENTF